MKGGEEGGEEEGRRGGRGPDNQKASDHCMERQEDYSHVLLPLCPPPPPLDKTLEDI